MVSNQEDFTAPIEDISQKQRYSFYGKQLRVTYRSLAIHLSVNLPARNDQEDLWRVKWTFLVDQDWKSHISQLTIVQQGSLLELFLGHVLP